MQARTAERPSPVPTRRRAPRTPPAQRRAQLLDVAETLLAEGGSDALRMDSLAQAAGVTRPVVYDQFGNRDGLVVALLERHVDRISRPQARAITVAPSFEAQLRHATHAYLTVARTHGPAIRALVESAHLSPTIEQARRRIRAEGVRTWTRRYQEHAALRPADARALATSHLAGLSALAGLCIEGRLTTTRAVELHVSSVLAAIDALAEAHRT